MPAFNRKTGDLGTFRRMEGGRYDLLFQCNGAEINFMLGIHKELKVLLKLEILYERGDGKVCFFIVHFDIIIEIAVNQGSVREKSGAIHVVPAQSSGGIAPVEAK